jgi:hypothetical protein
MNSLSDLICVPGVLACSTTFVVLALTFAEPLPASAPPEADEALDRTRMQVKMLDDLFKVAVVDITNRYDGPPAAKVVKSVFDAARANGYFVAKLLDATGSPMNEGNAPQDDFEKRAAQAMNDGQTYVEEIVSDGVSRRLRVATLVPAVVKKCASCHGAKVGDVLGFLSYDIPIR